MPYTGLFVLSGVKALAEAEKREQGMIFFFFAWMYIVILTCYLRLAGVDARVDTDGLIQDWIKHHNVRLVLVFGALVLSVLESIAP